MRLRPGQGSRAQECTVHRVVWDPRSLAINVAVPHMLKDMHLIITIQYFDGHVEGPAYPWPLTRYEVLSFLLMGTRDRGSHLQWTTLCTLYSHYACQWDVLRQVENPARLSRSQARKYGLLKNFEPSGLDLENTF